MGRFAEVADVTSRYEGEFPEDREAWVALRIDDVESILVGLVPSLALTDSEIGEARLGRAKVLVADKVLQLYRNPDGTSQRSETAGQFSESRAYYKDVMGGRIAFTAEELNSVRLRSRRSNVGMAALAPWRLT